MDAQSAWNRNMIRRAVCTCIGVLVLEQALLDFDFEGTQLERFPASTFKMIFVQHGILCASRSMEHMSLGQ